MKLVTAIIEPSKLDPIRNELIARGIHGVTITEHRNVPAARNNESDGKEADQTNKLVPALKIEIAVADDSDVDLVSSILTSFCTQAEATPRVHEVDHVIRIRTGETGLSAL